MKVPNHTSIDREILLGQQVKTFSAGRVLTDPRKDPLTGERRALDTNDPIDRAIMARLAERESQGLAKVSDPFETGRRADDNVGDASGGFGKKQVTFGKRV